MMLCFLSGLFGAIIFRQNALGVFAWVALVPYFIALSRFTTARQVIAGTYVFGFTWYYLNLWWLHTLTVFSLWIPAGVPVLALAEATYFLPFAFAAHFAWRRLPQWMVPWVLALMWPGAEYLRMWTDLAFPWNYLSHSQVGAWGGDIIQWADLGGTFLVSFLLALGNATLATLVVSRLRMRLLTPEKLVPTIRAVNESVTVAVVLIVALAFGGMLLRGAGNAAAFSPGPVSGPKPIPFRVAVIQPGTSQLKKWDAMMGKPDDTPEVYNARFAATEQEMTSSTFSLVRRASEEQPVDLYVLPETTFLSPYFVYQQDVHRGLHQLAAELNADFFFGADNRLRFDDYLTYARPGYRDPQPSAPTTTMALARLPLRVNASGTTEPDWQREGRTVNLVAAWQVTPEEGLSGAVYNKVQLVPFGEMTPLIGRFEWFQKMAIAGTFYPGMESTIFETSGTRYGAMICFESAFPALAGALSRGGAQMLTVLTNDAWYDPNYLINQGGFWGTLFRVPGIRGLAAAGPKQHFAHSVLRAVETRLPLVRSANTGISTIISHVGTYRESLPYGTAGYLTGSIYPAERKPTFYSRHGDWFAWLSLATLCAMLAWQVRHELRQRRALPRQPVSSPGLER